MLFIRDLEVRTNNVVVNATRLDMLYVNKSDILRYVKAAEQKAIQCNNWLASG